MGPGPQASCQLWFWICWVYLSSLFLTWPWNALEGRGQWSELFETLIPMPWSHENQRIKCWRILNGLLFRVTLCNTWTSSFVCACVKWWPYFSSSQEVIIKLADFGFAKIDRGDLVTPQFTPYYVSPQVMNLSSHIFSNNAWATVLDWVIPLKRNDGKICKDRQASDMVCLYSGLNWM